MKVRFKRLSPYAIAPVRMHASDAGFDLYSSWIEEDRKRNIVTYHTDIAMEIPDGYVGLIFPRSSIYKHQLELSNSVGVIDSGYRGEIQFKYRIVQPHISRYGSAERVGQIIIIPIPDIEFEESDSLDESDRGDGGFGSTGK